MSEQIDIDKNSERMKLKKCFSSYCQVFRNSLVENFSIKFDS